MGFGPWRGVLIMENKNLTPEEIAKNRFDKLLRTIFYIRDVAGFRIEGRITLVDKKTGQIWK